MAEPSPGLSLLAAYLREGERLIEEGWAPARIDDVLEAWGMEMGPFRLARKIGPYWDRRLRTIAGRRPMAEQPPQIRERALAADADVEMALVEQMISVLALEISRLWDTVAPPVADGWRILEVLLLGAPAFRGGVLDAARAFGQESVCARLMEIAGRRGPPYSPDELLERGLLIPGDRPADDVLLDGGASD